MISTNMRFYDYFTLGEPNAYGQRPLPAADAEPAGFVKMAIYESTQSVQDNINYKSANYVGLTNDALIDDTFIIQYGDERLKVLYVNPHGRYRQVFMSRL